MADTPKAELKPTEKITEAINDLHKALEENFEAGKNELQASLRKKKAHYNLLKAKERLSSLERELATEQDDNFKQR